MNDGLKQAFYSLNYSRDNELSDYESQRNFDNGLSYIKDVLDAQQIVIDAAKELADIYLSYGLMFEPDDMSEILNKKVALINAITSFQEGE